MFDTREKKERSLGTRLFLKGERCASPKCATIRRGSRPGMHGKSRRRALSEFGEQLQEKQKFKFSYGLRERQFRRLFAKALKNPGVTGEMLMRLLECRLDNVIYRTGFTPSRSVARQLVGHGHFVVNGRKVTAPSYSVKSGDVISVREQSKNHPFLKEVVQTLKKREAPSWVSVDPDALRATVTALPKDHDVSFDVNKVVDYYSKILK